jgi:hypothetical protein
MPGGIQPGMCATDALARSLDESCKYQTTKVYSILHAIYGDDLVCQSSLRKEQIPGNIGACVPDGGLWFYKGTLIATFEGKKQQDRGNAIERWFKNNFICRMINKDISYVTFACGEGAYKNGTIGKSLNVAHLSGFNQYNPGENSCFMQPEGFDRDFIADTMIEVIEERINWLTNQQ